MQSTDARRGFRPAPGARGELPEYARFRRHPDGRIVVEVPGRGWDVQHVVTNQADATYITLRRRTRKK